MKKHRIHNTFIIILLVILVGGYIFFTLPNKTVDFTGRVEDIEVNLSETTAMVTIHESISHSDYTYKLEIPLDWKCKDRNGKKVAVMDIKKGCFISLNFKGSPVYKDGFYYVKPKGTIKVV